MNRKGFTLVELIATIVVLAMVMGIASYSIIGIMNNSKNKNYELLVKNIKDAAEVYYQECRYSNNSGLVDGNGNSICDSATITLGQLVEYGYLKGNTKNGDKYALENPKTGESINNCEIAVNYNSGTITIVNRSGSACPDY